MTICPACPTTAEARLVETHEDRIGGKTYRILSCGHCGVVFSQPREPVGADWYEKAAPIRHLERRPPPEKDWRYRTFFAVPPPGGKLLDVGCGDGDFLSLAQSRGFACSGFDFERRMVDLARSRGIPDVESSEFYAYCAGRAENEFDCVTLFDVLEHSPEPALFLGGLRRLLKLGGHVAITLPNARRPLPWRREEHDFPPHHFTRWTPAAMRGFLERNGFTIVRQESATLKVGYLADHFFFYALMPWLLAPARRFLFGRTRGTISDLYAAEDSRTAAESAKKRCLGTWPRGVLADKALRQRLVNSFKAGCFLVIWPAAALATAYCRLRLPECGDCLFTLARLDRK